MSANDGAAALLSVFDRIYVLNLPHRTDRRREVEADLRRIGLSLSHPAVTLFPATAPDDPGPFPSKGARGCFESHLAIHRAIVASGVVRALILEDDASPAADFAARLTQALPVLQAGEWDLFYSVHDLAPLPADCDLGHGLMALSAGNTFTNAHFLGVSQAFSRAAVDYLQVMLTRPPGDPDGGPMHVDGAYNWLRKDRPDLRVITTRRPLAVQRSSRSDIAELRLHDRLPVIRTLVGLLRRLRHQR